MDHAAGDMERKPTDSPYAYQNKEQNQKEKIANHASPFDGLELRASPTS